jgi:hypothetical protein
MRQANTATVAATDTATATPATVTEKVIRLGVNRGNPRLWLEGSTLTEALFHRGALYTAVIMDDLAIVLRLDMNGKRRVSGKTRNGKDWPIIDMNGQDLVPFANVDLVMSRIPGRIVITRK